MTVSVELNRMPLYSGNGVTTTFAYSFPIQQSDDLKVSLIDSAGNETLQSVGTHYTLTGVGGDTGGNVVFVTAPASGYNVSIWREMSFTQPVDFKNQGEFSALTHERAFDRATMLIQQVQDNLEQFEIDAGASTATDYKAATVAVMKALTGMTTGATVQTLGYYASGDGGSGLYRYDAASVATDNGGTVIAPNSGGGRFLLLFNEYVHARQFGVVGGGVTDDTTTLQSAIDYGGPVYLPSDTYKYSVLTFSANGSLLFGDGPTKTILNSTSSGVGVSSIKNSDQTTTRLFCGLKDLQVNCSSLAVGYCVDWKSMQFGRIENVWIYGGGAGCEGIRLVANWTTTECTYNDILNCYIGNIGKGISYGDGANTNTIINTRIQPLATGYGHFLSGTAANRVSNNTVIGGGVEYPGAVSKGVYAGTGVDVATFVGVRFEYLSIAVESTAASNGLKFVGNYYSSNTANYAIAGTNHVFLEGGGLTLPNAASSSTTELDYYQRGTFTPTIIGSGTAGTGTYTLNSGSYTRIGNRCFFELYIQQTAHTGTGDMIISGLPFTIKNGAYGISFDVSQELLTYTGALRCIGFANTTQARLYSSSSASGLTPVAMDTDCTIYVSGSYPI